MPLVLGSGELLAGVPFSIEGDPKAVRAARAIVRDLKGHSFTIRKEQKEAYHAWGMFASPLLTALLAATERVAGAPGGSPKAARKRMRPTPTQTLANSPPFGAPAALSGPLAPRDAPTLDEPLQLL